VTLGSRLRGCARVGSAGQYQRRPELADERTVGLFDHFTGDARVGDDGHLHGLVAGVGEQAERGAVASGVVAGLVVDATEAGEAQREWAQR
jgi:hypothetical protein